MKIYFLIILFSLSQHFIYAQENKSHKTDSTSAIDKKIDELLERIKNLEKSDKQHIGTLTFFSGRRFPVYNNSNVKIESILIDSIKIVVSDGYIVDVKAFADNLNQIYTNKQSPIAITSYRFSNKTDRLFNYDEDRHIIAQEILFPDLDKNYISDDTIFVFKPRNSILNLVKGAGINTILDIRLYSDALGLADAQSNGIAQTDMRFKQIIHRHNIPNRGFFFVQYSKVNFNISKFDSKYKYLDTLAYSRSKFFQQSFVNAEFSLNFFNGWLAEKKTNNIFYFDGGSGISIGRLSKKNDSLTSEIMMPLLFIESGISYNFSDNFSTLINARLIYSYLPENEFTPDKNRSLFYKFCIELAYNPLGKKANRIFARGNWTTSERRADKKNSFFQFQIGYSILLTQLIDKK